MAPVNPITGLGYFPHSPKILCELFWKILNKEFKNDDEPLLQCLLKGIRKLLLLIQCFWIGNWSYWNVISWKWVKYPILFTGFTGATGNGVFGYKNCVDKMVSQCSIGYDSCSLDRYFCILHANHRSLISWFGYFVIISSQWIWNTKRNSNYFPIIIIT